MHLIFKNIEILSNYNYYYTCENNFIFGGISSHNVRLQFSIPHELCKNLHSYLHDPPKCSASSSHTDLPNNETSAIFD